MEDLDRGFIRPRYPGQVAISYLQAGFVCRFIAKRWGQEKLGELLQAFARNEPTGDNIRAVLGLAPQDFDEHFLKYMRDFLGPALEGLKPWRRHVRKAREFARNRDWEAVLDPARAAQAAYPQHVGSGSSYELLAVAHEKLGNRVGAVAELQEYERRGGRQPETLKKLAGWLEEARRIDEAAYTYEGLLYNWPQDEEIHTHLGELYLEIGRHELARREFQVALALEPLDRATAEYNLARAYVKMGDLAKARLHVLQALERAPTFRPALHLLQKVRQ